MVLPAYRLLLPALIVWATFAMPALAGVSDEDEDTDHTVTVETTIPEDEAAYPKLRLGLANSAYAYNSENGAWEKTRGTMTYFEDVFLPYLRVAASDRLDFKVGAGFLVPFNQEDKVKKYYPYVQSKYRGESITLELGSLDGNHDFPQPLLDPLVGMLPQLRLNDSGQIPIPYETFPEGIHAHGLFEYGLAFKWPDTFGHGELYMNWQLPDTAQHRERFDVGLIQSFESPTGVPLYAGIHYWHNGGHENFHPIEVTENYTAALGFRDKKTSALYLASLYLPNRADKSLNVFGQGVFFEHKFALGEWVVAPQLFVSDEYFRVKNHKFISVEGDPFYRTPLYVGVDVSRTWNLWKSADVKFGLVNGVFAPEPGASLKVRYDQMIKLDFRHELDL